MNAIALFLLGALQTAPELPVVTLHADDTLITKSCRIEIPPGTVIADTNGDGVLRVTASDVTIEFAPSAILRGAPADARPDTYEGYAIRVNGVRNVTIRGGHISGYRCAVWATDADGLALEKIDASDNRRQHLKSTPLCEDGEDWMFPHQNDENQWLLNYSAALYVEDSTGVVVRNCHVWHGQTALCLDRADEARVYDNDFSFNSAWGIAMWRSSRCVVSRNACDFCIRGYSDGVYNRGQDSAGILMFEQCCDNVIAENSATHGGDAFFGYSGREARGEAAEDDPAKVQEILAQKLGCNRNLLVRNDFSYAAAHGIEMTFSFGNRYLANRLVGNAICGVWNGYSQDTLIAKNEIAENGPLGYGLERGGINIDTSRHNRIIGNEFRANRCGVHLWWAAENRYRPWIDAHCPDYEGNVIADNTFIADELAWHFRGPGAVTLARNTLRDVKQTEQIVGDVQVVRDDSLPAEDVAIPAYPVFGDTRPVGARAALRGRQNIIMTEWGPWDHASPLVREIENTGATRTYAIECAKQVKATSKGGDIAAQLESTGDNGNTHRYTLTASKPGVCPFEVTFDADNLHETLRGALLAATWTVREFRTPPTASDDADEWRATAKSADGQTRDLSALRMLNVPSDLPPDPATERDRAERRRRGPRGATWGLIATTKVHIPAGKWRLAVVSAGGVRVLADDETVIDAWERSYRPQQHDGMLTLAEPREVELVVEQCRVFPPITLLCDIAPAE